MLCCSQCHTRETGCGFKSTQSLQWGEAFKYHTCDFKSRVL
nr:MAG TPA: Soluble cytochrome cA c5, Protein stability, Shewanella [Caudoviricetes sp.]